MTFDNYAAQDIAPMKEIAFELLDLRSPRGGCPTVHVVHAGEGNDPYTNAIILDARGALIEHSQLEDKDLTPEQRTAQEAASELRTRRRLAMHVVRRLENVQGRGDNGEIVDLLDDGRNPDQILAFMTKIPWFVVRKILLFAIQESRWQMHETPAVAAETIAKK